MQQFVNKLLWRLPSPHRSMEPYALSSRVREDTVKTYRRTLDACFF
jgi:hypothetical protein